MHPLVSIIIPYYNGERFIAETLNSLLKQNYSNLEIIIVSDGSLQSSLDVLEPFLTLPNNQVRLIRQENMGQAAARNTGLRAAQGTIIGMIDQDDVWPVEHITNTLPYLLRENDSFDFVRGMTQKLQLQPDTTWKLQDPEFLPSLIGSALYTRSTIERVGFFDDTMREGEDFDWNTRLNELELLEKRIPETTLFWRKHTNNQSDTKDFIKNGQLLSLKKKLERIRNNTSL
jgi:glycosyltransferase involved in cell wall biosynthesis